MRKPDNTNQGPFSCGRYEMNKVSCCPLVMTTAHTSVPAVAPVQVVIPVLDHPGGSNGTVLVMAISAVVVICCKMAPNVIALTATNPERVVQTPDGGIPKTVATLVVDLKTAEGHFYKCEPSSPSIWSTSFRSAARIGK